MEPEAAQQVPPKDVVIYIPCPITRAITEQLLGVLSQCVNVKVERAHLHMNTLGGDCDEGIAIYEAVKSMPMPIYTHNLSRVDSIGILAFLAGSKRKASPNATFLMHGVSFDVRQGQTIDQTHMKKNLALAKSQQARILAVLQARTAIPKTVVENSFAEETEVTAEQALAWGLIEAIEEPVVPEGAGVHTLQFIGN